MLMMMASVGLPGTSGFVGEFLILVGAFQDNTWVALLATTGIILGAAYMLWLYRRVVFGKITRDDVKGMLDLSPREVAIFAPLVLVVMWMGIYPSSFLNVTSVSVEALIQNYQTALTDGVGTSVAAR
jgi:NADH-quinone oxidoreductase subunit M